MTTNLRVRTDAGTHECVEADCSGIYRWRMNPFKTDDSGLSVWEWLCPGKMAHILDEVAPEEAIV